MLCLDCIFLITLCDLNSFHACKCRILVFVFTIHNAIYRICFRWLIFEVYVCILIIFNEKKNFFCYVKIMSVSVKNLKDYFITLYTVSRPLKNHFDESLFSLTFLSISVQKLRSDHVMWNTQYIKNTSSQWFKLNFITVI